MAAQFAGKWDLLEATGVEELLSALGTTNEFLQLAKQMKESNDEVVEEITVDGDKVSVAYFRNREKADEESYTLGKTSQVETADGRSVSVTASVSGNKLVYEETGPYTCTTTMEVTGDTALTTITSGSTTATAKLKKL